jgi:hypothetical protein
VSRPGKRQDVRERGGYPTSDSAWRYRAALVYPFKGRPRYGASELALRTGYGDEDEEGVEGAALDDDDDDDDEAGAGVDGPTTAGPLTPHS